MRLRRNWRPKQWPGRWESHASWTGEHWKIQMKVSMMLETMRIAMDACRGFRGRDAKKEEADGYFCGHEGQEGLDPWMINQVVKWSIEGETYIRSRCIFQTY